MPTDHTTSTRHQFGGGWTVDKLQRVREYLAAYMEILKSRPYETLYVDAFAGTGRVDVAGNDRTPSLPGLVDSEVERFIQGSAAQALEMDRPFSQYIFVEQSPRRCEELTGLRARYPNLRDRICIENRDANEFLVDFCRQTDWRKSRAVLFLDPYGMAVDWTTIRAIAATRSIDLWYLFPLGVAVSRLLVNDGQIPDEWRVRLDRLFGEPGWYEAFYRRRKEDGLFGQVETTEKVADYDAISRYFLDRLRTVFPGVAENPLQLCNTTGIPLFLLCFATANPHAKAALKIARHLLGRPKAGRR